VAGMGVATGNNIYDNALTPNFSFRISRKAGKDISYGITTYLENYSFSFPSQSYLGGMHIQFFGNVVEKSSYFFISPTLGIKANRYLKINIMPSVGVNTYGNELFHYAGSGKPFHWSTVPISLDTTYNSSENIKKVIFRFAIELQENIPLSKNLWFIIIEGLNFSIPGTSITKTETLRQAKHVNPYYPYLQIGFMYRFTRRMTAIIE
jgi:hypothetical protein